MNKLIGISIPVAFRSPGNVIMNKMVDFKVYQDNRSYIAVPLISSDQRRLADLPPEMIFECCGKNIISNRLEGKGNMDLLKDIFQELTVKTDI
jgi:hypothetical protein